MRTGLCLLLLLFSILSFFLSYMDKHEWIYVSAAVSIVNVGICLYRGGTDV